MKNKFISHTLIMFGVLIVAIISYFLLITAYVEDQNNVPMKVKKVICDHNWSEVNPSNNIYNCGDRYEICDIVDGKICVPSQEYYLTKNNQGNTVKLGFGDSVSVTVTRNRWYGTIKESGENSYVYIFDTIKIPMKVNGIDLVWYHQFFLVFCVAITISFFSIQILKYRVERRNS